MALRELERWGELRQSALMNYIVKTKRGYYEERESYRDPVTGKPRSRFLRYLGKFGEIDWANAFKSDPGMAAAERAMEKAGERVEVERPSNLPQGLHVGPVDPTPVEPSPSDDTPDTSSVPRE